MSIEKRILDLPAFADYNDRLCKTIGDMTKENEALKQRIKCLEEAGDALANNHNPFTFIDWLKAKEDQP